MCDTCLNFLTKQPAQCICTVARTEIPRRHQVDGCLSPDCLFSFFLFLLPTTLRPERSLVMKQQPSEGSATNLTSRHCFRHMTDNSFFLIMQRCSSTPRLPAPDSVCLPLFRQMSLQHSEPLALWALHLIFIWSMKADGILSSQTPCEKPEES